MRRGKVRGFFERIEVFLRRGEVFAYAHHNHCNEAASHNPSIIETPTDRFATRQEEGLAMHMQVKTVSRTGSLGSRRKSAFRTVRFLLAMSLVVGMGYLGWRALTLVTTDQAYINAEIVPVRAPMAGELHMAGIEPGTKIEGGSPLLRVENTEFANSQIAAELNRMQELIERLRFECEEAEVRLPKMEEIHQHAAALKRDKLMSPVQFMEEEAKLILAKASVEKRRAQIALAENRRVALEQQATALQTKSIAAPFDGVVWSSSAQDGSSVQTHETVLQLIDPKRVWVEAFLSERHAGKFRVGMSVTVRLLDDRRALQGRVESVRAGVGRIPVGNSAAVAPGEFAQRRIALRVRLESENPFPATEFYGVGRSVAIELPTE